MSPNLKIVKGSGGIALPRVKKYSFNSSCCYYQKMLGIRKVKQEVVLCDNGYRIIMKFNIRLEARKFTYM